MVPVAAADLDRFWAEALRAWGSRFKPLARLTSTGTSSGPWCKGTIRSDRAQGNALYCARTDELVYDPGWFEKDLIQGAGGPLGAATVIAHEYGHVVQQRLGLRGPVLLLELQADCFAGAWLRKVADGGSPSFVLDAPRELAGPISQLLKLRDSLDRTSAGSAEHGTGFDRAHSVLDGLDQGPSRCLDYIGHPPTVTAQAWLGEGDERQGGNAPLPSLLAAVTADLDDFYTITSTAYDWSEWQEPRVVVHQPDDPRLTTEGRLVVDTGPVPDGCQRPAAWCLLDDAIHLDGSALKQRHTVGDLATGVTVAEAYGNLAQLRTGQTDDAQLTNCLTGVWLGSRFPNAQRPAHALVLSPGDLDEAALTLLLDPSDGVAALRSALKGFDSGLPACRPSTPIP